MKARLGWEGFIVRGVGGLQSKGGKVTSGQRGFTTEVPAVEGGFPTSNDAAGKRRLKRR